MTRSFCWLAFVRPILALALLTPTVLGAEQPTADGVASDAASVPAGKLLSCRVVDDASGEPMRSFRVLAGTDNKTRGAACAIWQSHTIQEITTGQYDWPPRRGYRVCQLRFEADGYVPVLSDWIRRGAPPKAVTIRMRRDPGRAIEVVDLQGNPAAGAEVAIAMPNRGVRLKNGKITPPRWGPRSDLRQRFDNPIVGKTDAAGCFTLPAEPSLSVVYIVHEAGIAEIPYGPVDVPQLIQLLPWGSIEGRVVWIDQVGANEELRYMISHDFGYPEFLTMYGTVTTDDDGEFHLEKLPPGRIQISRSFGLANGPSYLFPGLLFDVKAGEPTSVIVGGRGRPVVGKLIGLENWDNVKLRITPSTPRPRGRDGWVAHGMIRQSNLGAAYFRGGLPVAADGSFRFENVLPASYRLFVTGDAKNYLAGRRFRIDTIDGGATDEPQDLGEIQITRR